MITTSIEVSVERDLWGKGMNGLKRVQENQGVINIHPDTDKTLTGMLWRMLVTPVRDQ